MFWIIAFLIILIIAIATTATKLSNEKYSGDLKHYVKNSLKGIVIGGVVGLIGLILLYLCFAYPLDFSSQLVVLSMILSGVGVIATLIYWIACPNSNSVTIEKHKERIRNELEKLNFVIDNKQSYYYMPCEIEIAIDSVNKKIALCKYRADKFTVFDSTNFTDFQVLENNQVTENTSSGLGRAIVGGVIAGGAGAIVGVLTKKDSFKHRSVDIRFVTGDTVNPYKNIRLVTVKDENGAYMYNSQYRTALNYANNVNLSIANAIKA